MTQGRALPPVPTASGGGWRPYSALTDPCPSSYRGSYQEWLWELKTSGTCPTCGARTLLVITETKLEGVWCLPHNRQTDRAETLLGGRLEELTRLRPLPPLS